jgi:hypothetical protein
LACNVPEKKQIIIYILMSNLVNLTALFACNAYLPIIHIFVFKDLMILALFVTNFFLLCLHPSHK